MQQCKQWNGPANSVEELHAILNSNPDKREKIVQTELSFYQDTHKADVIKQTDLFKINGISHDEQLLNLCSLLAEHDLACGFISIPSNKDAATVLLSCNSADLTQAHNEDLTEVGRYYITLMKEGKINIWHIASCEGKNPDGTYKMDHLIRVQRGSDLKWKQPARINKINLKAEPVVECGVDGESDVLQERNILLLYGIMFIFQIWLK